MPDKDKPIDEQQTQNPELTESIRARLEQLLDDINVTAQNEATPVAQRKVIVRAQMAELLNLLKAVYGSEKRMEASLEQRIEETFIMAEKLRESARSEISDRTATESKPTASTPVISEIGVAGSALAGSESGQEKNMFADLHWESVGDALKTTLPDGRKVKVELSITRDSVDITKIYVDGNELPESSDEYKRAWESAVNELKRRKYREEPLMPYLKARRHREEEATPPVELDGKKNSEFEDQFTGREWGLTGYDLEIQLSDGRKVKAEIVDDSSIGDNIRYWSKEGETPMSEEVKQLAKASAEADLERRHREGLMPFEAKETPEPQKTEKTRADIIDIENWEPIWRLETGDKKGDTETDTTSDIVYRTRGPNSLDYNIIAKVNPQTKEIVAIEYESKVIKDDQAREDVLKKAYDDLVESIEVGSLAVPERKPKKSGEPSENFSRAWSEVSKGIELEAAIKNWSPAKWEGGWAEPPIVGLYSNGPAGIECEVRALLNVDTKEIKEITANGPGIGEDEILRNRIIERAKEVLLEMMSKSETIFDKDKFSQYKYAPIELHGLAAEVAERHQESVWKRAGVEAAIGSTQAPGARGYLDIPRWLWARRNVLGKEGGLGEDIKKMFEEFHTVRDKEVAQGIGEGHLLTKEETDAALGRLLAHRNRMLERFGDVAPEKRAELADAIDSLLWEFSLRPTADMNERDREINRVIQEHADLKVNGMQALKAGVDTALLGLGIFTGGTGFLIRGGVGGGFRIALRGQRVAREARSKHGRELAAEREQSKEELWAEIVAKQAKSEDVSALESEFINLHFAGRRRAKIIEGDNWWEQLRQATTGEGRERLQQLIGRRLVYDGVAGTGRGLLGFMETAEQERQFRDEWYKATKESKGKGLKQQLLTSAKFRGRKMLTSAGSFGVLLQGEGLIAASVGRKIEHSTQALQVAIDAAHAAPSSQATRGLLGEAYQRVANALIEGTASQEQILAEASQRGELMNPSFWNHAVGFDRTYGRVWHGLNMAKDWLCGIETPASVGSGGAGEVPHYTSVPTKTLVEHEGATPTPAATRVEAAAMHTPEQAGKLPVPESTSTPTKITTPPPTEAYTATPSRSETLSPTSTPSRAETPSPTATLHPTETPQVSPTPAAPGAGTEAGMGIRSEEGVAKGGITETLVGKVEEGSNPLDTAEHQLYIKNSAKFGFDGKGDVHKWAQTTTAHDYAADTLKALHLAKSNPDSELSKYLAKEGKLKILDEADKIWNKVAPKVADPDDLRQLGAELAHHKTAFNTVFHEWATNFVHKDNTIEATFKDGKLVGLSAHTSEHGPQAFGHIPERGAKITGDLSVADRRGITRAIDWKDQVDDSGVHMRTAHFSATDFDRFMDRPDTARSHLPSGWTIDMTADDHGVPEHAIIKNALGDQVTVLANDQWDDPSIATHEFTQYIDNELGRMTGRTTGHEAMAAIPAEHLRGGKTAAIEDSQSSGRGRGKADVAADVQKKAPTAADGVEVNQPSADVWDDMWERGDKGGKTIAAIKEFHNKFAVALNELPQPSGDDENLIRSGVVNYLRLCGDPRSPHYDREVGELWNKVVSAGIDPTKKEGLIEGMKHLGKSEARYIVDKLIPDFMSGKRSIPGMDLGDESSPIPYADAKRSPDIETDIANKNSVNAPPPVDVIIGTAGEGAGEVPPPPLQAVVGTSGEKIEEAALKVSVGTAGESALEKPSVGQGVVVATSGERVVEEPLDVAVGTAATQVAEGAKPDDSELRPIEPSPFRGGLSKRNVLPPLEVVTGTPGEQVEEAPDLKIAAATSGEQVAESESVVTTQGEEAVELAKQVKTK